MKQNQDNDTELYLKISSKKVRIQDTISKTSTYKVIQHLGSKCNITIFCEYMDFNVLPHVPLTLFLSSLHDSGIIKPQNVEFQL